MIITKIWNKIKYYLLAVGIGIVTGATAIILFFIKRAKHNKEIIKENEEMLIDVKIEENEHEKIINNLDNQYNDLATGKRVKKTK